MIEPLRPPKLAESIADHIEGLILEGVLRPGERLASERDLAERLEVSRPSLREAIRLLETRGLLETGRNGTVVAEFLASLTAPLAGLLRSDARVTDDYFEYREGVEGKAAGLAALRATGPERQAVRSCLAAMEEAHRLDDPEKEAETDIELHRLVYEASHNLVILHVMRAFSEMLRRDIFFSRIKVFRQDGVREALLEQHRAIGAAVVSGDVAAAEAASRAHMIYTARAIRELRRDEERLGRAVRRLGRGDLLAS
ncbi:FadR/GntR family transcriptional regulator [Ancylobacter terrae]|uniref:FadR/GntR family transcriptional regulator n=1 Tax=Ancylobacter sp. sgz301288 TaxID=3342077 RepID=UPI00385D03CF